MRNSHALRVGRKPPRRRAVSHHSREVPITERSGTASRKRTRIGAAHKSRFIFASRISRVQVSELVTAWGQLPERFSMLLPPAFCLHVMLARRRECGPKPGKSQPSASAASFVMSVVPDITAGDGAESDEILVCDGSVGLSQSEGAQVKVPTVDRSLAGWPTIWELVDARSTLRCQQVA